MEYIYCILVVLSVNLYTNILVYLQNSCSLRDFKWKVLKFYILKKYVFTNFYYCVFENQKLYSKKLKYCCIDFTVFTQ